MASVPIFRNVPNFDRPRARLPPSGMVMGFSWDSTGGWGSWGAGIFYLMYKEHIGNTMIKNIGLEFGLSIATKKNLQKIQVCSFEKAAPIHFREV